MVDATHAALIYSIMGNRKVALGRVVRSSAIAGLIVASISATAVSQPLASRVQSSASASVERDRPDDYAAAGIVWVAGDVLNELACHREGKRLVREDPDVLSYRCDPLVFGVYRLWLRLYI